MWPGLNDMWSQPADCGCFTMPSTDEQRVAIVKQRLWGKGVDL